MHTSVIICCRCCGIARIAKGVFTYHLFGIIVPEGGAAFCESVCRKAVAPAAGVGIHRIPRTSGRGNEVVAVLCRIRIVMPQSGHAFLIAVIAVYTVVFR